MKKRIQLTLSGLIGIALINPIMANETQAEPTLIDRITELTEAEVEKKTTFRHRLPITIPEPPYTADDIEAEILFGRELASKVLGRYPVLKDDQLNYYVNSVGQVLVQFSARPELTYYFIVMDTPDINAYAAPGGYVFITKGALEQVKNEAELAAILAHEMGHIEERHYVKAIGLRSQKGDTEDGLGAILSGGGAAAATAFSQAVGQAMEILFEKGLQSKKDEFEADEASVWLLVNAGYHPSALMDYFERIRAVKNQQTQVLSDTHPPMDERITRLNNIVNEHGLNNLRLATLEERLNENVK
jgi:predicted Zn-dependent protease